MTIDATSLRHVIKNKGKFVFNRNNILTDSETIIPGQYDQVTHDLYRMAKTEIDKGKKTITMTGLQDDDLKADTVNIIFEDGCATMGSVTKPGLIFSDSFSGCVFYLFREPLGHVIGVHANRSSGKLADPSRWMAKRGGKQILKWDSKGKITPLKTMTEPRRFGAVFAYIYDKIDFYAVEHIDGQIQKTLFEKTSINY